jgi:hypothetical protein
VLQRALRSRSFLLRGQERCKERRVVPCLTLERLFKREALLGVSIRRLRASESSGNQRWERGEEPSILIPILSIIPDGRRLRLDTRKEERENHNRKKRKAENR